MRDHYVLPHGREIKVTSDGARDYRVEVGPFTREDAETFARELAEALLPVGDAHPTNATRPPVQPGPLDEPPVQPVEPV